MNGTLVASNAERIKYQVVIEFISTVGTRDLTPALSSKQRKKKKVTAS